LIFAYEFTRGYISYHCTSTCHVHTLACDVHALARDGHVIGIWCACIGMWCTSDWYV